MWCSFLPTFLPTADQLPGKLVLHHGKGHRMRNRYGRRLTLKQRVFRWLGIVSPSGAYPLPPRWALSKLGRSRYYPEQPKRGLNIASPSDVLALLASDVAAGPVPRGALTRFGTGDPEHTHGWTSAGLCGPGSGYQVNCFSQQPYGPQKGGEGSC